MSSTITPRELARKIANDHPIYLLDVRQPQEHDLAALPGSVLIPLNELPSRASEVQPPNGALVVVYCHHGVRSLRGAAFLQQCGLQNVVSLTGGIDAWSREVDPTIPQY